MPVLNIEGVGKVTVGDNFLQLSPDDQAATVEEIVASAGKKQAAPAAPGVTEDVAKSFGSGVVRGGADIVGIGGNMASGLDYLVGELEKKGLAVDRQKMLETMPSWLRSFHERPAPKVGSPEIMNAIDQTTGLPITSYEPKTALGKGARVVGEFTPGALLGPGGPVRNFVNFALVPGAASEAAGRATEGTPLEPWMRAGAAVLAGGGAAAINRPGTAQRTLQQGLSGIEDQTIASAKSLMDDAASRGVSLTWAEALEQVAPGTGLTNLQRTLEGAPGSREVMGRFMAERPQQVEGAARQTFETIAPQSAAPSMVGPAVGAAAEGTANDVRQAINKGAEPFYTAARGDRMDPAAMAQSRSVPGWEEARNAVRSNPQLNRYVANLPDDSVGFLNEVKKYLDNAAENAASPINQQKNMQVAAGYGADARAIKQAAVDASPGYEVALNIESEMRRRFLDPLLKGPIGQLADKDITTKKAINALFPKNPAAGSEDEIAIAVSALAKRNQMATRQLVRAHAEATFNEAARNLQSGENQWGGANFAKAIAGNSQQRTNLREAVRAIGPDGDQIWQGFNRFLEVVEATGKRKQIGTHTAFSTQEIKDLSTGGNFGNTVKTLGSPNKLLSTVSDAWSRWQLGRNLDELAGILTDPRSASTLKAIASRPVGSNEALITAGRLIFIWDKTREQTKGARDGSRSK